MDNLSFNANYFQTLLKQFKNEFKNFSLVNATGQLIFSQDTHLELLTTSRLVSFQIVKKYLNPKVFDLIILNDPENGGYSFNQLIFIAPLEENLILIWNEETDLIDFKIPPTPIYEKNQKNTFIWEALINAHPSTKTLKLFFETQKLRLDMFLKLNEPIEALSFPKFQNVWLEATNELISTQISNKSAGSAESIYKINDHQLIKLKLLIEEKLNVNLITFDFTQTSPAQEIGAASHIIESALIKNLISFYQVQNFFSQSLLDKIKIMLPPKSIVSKAHPKGQWNQELQNIIYELCNYNLSHLSSQSRKNSKSFELKNILNFHLYKNFQKFGFFFSSKNFSIPGLESLVDHKIIKINSLSKSDQTLIINFNYIDAQTSNIEIAQKQFNDSEFNYFKINNQTIHQRQLVLKKDDQISLKWTLEN